MGDSNRSVFWIGKEMMCRFDEMCKLCDLCNPFSIYLFI